MSDGSSIEWTEATWNPVTGCDKVSPGCDNCYAERLSRRLQAMGNPRYRNAFELTIHPDQVELPLRWRVPRMIFVNSMSDLFHSRVPDEFIQRVFTTMVEAHQHTFQVLTKRPRRLARLATSLPWPPNLWIGTSVESDALLWRVDYLRDLPATVRFISCEPLLGPLHDLNLERIDWVITGGESGPGARPVLPTWVREIRDKCVHAGVPFFHKQWGGRTSKAGGRLLDGRLWSGMPQRTAVPA